MPDTQVMHIPFLPADNTHVISSLGPRSRMFLVYNHVHGAMHWLLSRILQLAAAWNSAIRRLFMCSSKHLGVWKITSSVMVTREDVYCHPNKYGRMKDFGDPLRRVDNDHMSKLSIKGKLGAVAVVSQEGG